MNIKYILAIRPEIQNQTKATYSFGLVFHTCKEALDFSAGKDVTPVTSDLQWQVGDINGGEKRMKDKLELVRLKGKAYQVMNIYDTGGISVETY